MSDRNIMFSLGCSELFGLLQMGDSAFPIGGFSFSAGLEGAVACGMVTNTHELGDYLVATLHNQASCDAIAALESYRAVGRSQLDRLATIDTRILELKVSPEARSMTLRMGEQLSRLLRRTDHSPLTTRWGEIIDRAEGHTTLPVAQGVGAAMLDIGEQGLFALSLYGAASIVLGASLRLMRISHYETQALLLSLSPLVRELYDRYAPCTLDDMATFGPLLDIASSLHERGQERMFMS